MLTGRGLVLNFSGGSLYVWAVQLVGQAPDLLEVLSHGLAMIMIAPRQRLLQWWAWMTLYWLLKEVKRYRALSSTVF